MSTFRVHIKKNGEEKVAEFPEASSLSFVEEKMRSTYGVRSELFLRSKIELFL